MCSRILIIPHVQYFADIYTFGQLQRYGQLYFLRPCRVGSVFRTIVPYFYLLWSIFPHAMFFFSLNLSIQYKKGLEVRDSTLCKSSSTWPPPTISSSLYVRIVAKFVCVITCTYNLHVLTLVYILDAWGGYYWSLKCGSRFTHQTIPTSTSIWY